MELHRTLCLLMAAVVVLPLARAESTEYSETWTPVQTGYVLTSARDFQLELAPGDTIAATLSWEGDADLDLRLIVPGGSCTVLPTPDVNCLANRPPPSTTCSYDRHPLFSNAGESFTRVAAVPGIYRVSVQAAFAQPATPVTYTLTISVNGAGPELPDPVAQNYIQSTGLFCHLP